MKTDKDVKTSRVAPITVTVSKQFFQGRDPVSEKETKNETLEVRAFATEPAKVRLSNGLTLNLGNFESARLDIGIDVPCYLEEADQAYMFAQSWVESRLEKEVQSLRNSKPSIF